MLFGMYWFDVICIIVGVVGAIWSLIGIIKGIKEHEFGLDVLALVAIISTLLVGEYFASVIVVVMTLTGDFLEDYASRQAEKELTKLISATPEVAHLVINNSEHNTEDVMVADVKVGDILQVLPGEVVPVDGEALNETVLDEAALTGESLPVNKVAGDTVLSGSVCSALFTMRATALATDSSYQKISQLADMAKSIKPSYVKLANTISIPFTIVSFIIAILAAFISGELLRFAEVLVLATPCPLLIAAPVSYLAGLSHAAKDGIIIKGGSVLERLSRVKIVAFDKTGTLTNGKPEFDRIELTDEGIMLGYDDAKVLQIVASLEKTSTHILGSAIVRHFCSSVAEPSFIEVLNFAESVGRGVTGEVVLPWDSSGIRHHIWVQKPHHELKTNPGETVVELIVSGKDIAHIILRDHLRENVHQIIKDLRSIGVRHIVMLTGDNPETANYIASSVGISDVRSSLLPHQKQEAVLGLEHACVLHSSGVKTDCEHIDDVRRAGKSPAVAMVGDGVNDAPVLMAADVGIAFGARGSSAATQSADIVLEHDDFKLVYNCFETSKRTMTIARQSMIGGITLSIILMLVAAFGFIPAVIGALLQEVIDVIAICNGLRARFGRAGR